MARPFAVTWPPPARLGLTSIETEDDGPAVALLAAVVERARLEAGKGNAEARAWLAEYVDAPAGAVLARGAVRLAA